MESIRITDPEQLDRLKEILRDVFIALDHQTVYAVSVAIDPIDKGAKFKLDNGLWSPPCRGDYHSD